MSSLHNAAAASLCDRLEGREGGRGSETQCMARGLLSTPRKCLAPSHREYHALCAWNQGSHGQSHGKGAWLEPRALRLVCAGVLPLPPRQSACIIHLLNYGPTCLSMYNRKDLSGSVPSAADVEVNTEDSNPFRPSCPLAREACNFLGKEGGYS